jgi:hypothetical protein
VPTLWRRSVQVLRSPLPWRPWVCNIKYTPLKYHEFRKAVLRPSFKQSIVLGKDRRFDTVLEAMESLGTLKGIDYETTTESIPYVTGSTARYIVYSRADTAIFSVRISLNTATPHVIVDPIIVLPDTPGIYKLVLSIPLVFFEYSWTINVADRGSSTMFELPAAKLPQPPGLYHNLGFTLRLDPHVMTP